MALGRGESGRGKERDGVGGLVEGLLDLDLGLEEVVGLALGFAREGRGLVLDIVGVMVVVVVVFTREAREKGGRWSRCVEVVRRVGIGWELAGLGEQVAFGEGCWGGGARVVSIRGYAGFGGGWCIAMLRRDCLVEGVAMRGCRRSQ